MNVFSDTKLPRSITIQLTDDSGNVSKEENVKIQLAREAGLKVINDVTILDVVYFLQGSYGAGKSGKSLGF